MSLRALQDYTFVSKYARYNEELKRRETWEEAVERVKDMHIQKYPQSEVRGDIEWAFERVKEKRVLGSQRALQFGGKPVLKKNARLYNCLSVETTFITKEGVKSFADFNDGDEIIALTHKGNWQHAVVKNHGKQELYPVEIVRNKAIHTVWATANHRWVLKNGEFQEGVSEGDRLLEASDILSNFNYDEAPPDERLYWAYGMVYGDGTRVQDSEGNSSYSMIRLCGSDRKYTYRFEELGFKTSSSLSLDGDFMAYTGAYLKTVPNPEVDDPRLIRAFVRGYLDADGEKNKNKDSNNLFYTIQVSGKEEIEFIRKCFPIAGSYIVSETDHTGEKTNFGTRGETIRFRIFNHLGKTAAQFKVANNGDGEKTRYEDVWCLEVEHDHSFVLPFGLTTGNCTVSYCDRLRFFQESFWLLLCGCGVGFSVQKHHVAKLPRLVGRRGESKVYVIPDSIEGWADSLGVLLSSYFGGGDFPEYAGYDVEFNYGMIRPEGSKLGSSSGKAPGPKPLQNALEKITGLLDRCIGDGLQFLRPLDAYDIIMHASDAVLSGGVRRSATICLFSPDDLEMATAKTGNWFNENPQRGRSNNSALLIRGQTSYEQFLSLMETVKEYGEPGFVWSDSTELMVNPCVEIGMWPVCIVTGETGWSFCNLCEINGKRVKTEADFAIAAKAAAIIGTLQAGYDQFDYLGDVTTRIVQREALLGVSITGMMDSPDVLFDAKLQRKMARMILKVNDLIAVKIGVNPCARATCVKPAGTTSCILGTASGIHAHHARLYIRRSQANYLEAPCRHFKVVNPSAVEKSVWSANGTDEVIAFCIEVPKGAKIKNDLDAITLLEHVKLTQQNWVSAGTREELGTQPWLKHNVSNTITVLDGEWEEVTKFIYKNRRYFAGISLLPQSGDKDYPQAPFTAIYTPTELAKMYGDGMPMASGLVVDGLHAFDDNLWAACDEALGITDLPEPVGAEEADPACIFNAEREHHEWEKKKDWCRRVHQFADRYLEGDDRQATYLMKDIHNWKLWCDLKREYKNVDYTTLFEESDETKVSETVACSGGACDVSYA